MLQSKLSFKVKSLKLPALAAFPRLLHPAFLRYSRSLSNQDVAEVQRVLERTLLTSRVSDVAQPEPIKASECQLQEASGVESRASFAPLTPFRRCRAETFLIG